MDTLHQPASIKITGSSSIHSEMMLPLMVMLLVFLLYAALIFLMKYKTEIIRIKKKNIKRTNNMISNFITMNGYGLYVWLSFSVVFISCALFILKQKKL